MTRACLAPDPITVKPSYTPPPGACDSHVHIFEDYPKYPLSPNRSFTPPEAPTINLIKMLDTLGIDRAVVVHSSAYGTDTRATEKAICAYPHRLRGVAVTDANTPPAEIERLTQLGFSGTRLSTVVKGTANFDSLEVIAKNVLPFNWHVAVHIGKSEELVALKSRLLNMGNTIVIDHVARVRSDEGVNAPGYQALLELLRSGRCWVKISALHRTSSQDTIWSDMKPLVDGVLNIRPDRVVWGTDWPHVNQFDSMQNDGELLAAFAQWVPDEYLRKMILVDNPANLYKFA